MGLQRDDSQFSFTCLVFVQYVEGFSSVAAASLIINERLLSSGTVQIPRRLFDFSVIVFVSSELYA